MDGRQVKPLTLNLFGGWEASYDGEPLRVRMLREGALLTYAVVERGKRHSRASLVGLLWPEMVEASGRNNLRVALSRLRQEHTNGRGRAPGTRQPTRLTGL